MVYIKIKTAITVIEKHLRLWGEPNETNRLALAEKIYRKEIRVIDPGEILNGYEEISNFIGILLNDSPGFKFSVAKPIEIHHNMAILHWKFGPETEPDRISGQDIFTFQNGQIALLLIFVDGVTSTT